MIRSEGYKIKKIFFQSRCYLCLFEDTKKEPFERETLMMQRNKWKTSEERLGGKSVSVSLWD